MRPCVGAWSSVHHALRAFRGGDTAFYGARLEYARTVILHGWRRFDQEYEFLCICDDVDAIDDPSMFRSDADEWLIDMELESDGEYSGDEGDWGGGEDGEDGDYGWGGWGAGGP